MEDCCVSSWRDLSGFKTPARVLVQHFLASRGARGASIWRSGEDHEVSDRTERPATFTRSLEE